LARTRRTTPDQLDLLGPDLLYPEPGVPLVCGAIEDHALASGWGPLIGLDEAGRGPLAGPVVAAACVLSHEASREAAALGLDDSKKMSENARERLFAWLQIHATAHAVAIISPETIDAMNILRASLHGMALAWQQVVDRDPALARARVLVDGRDRAPLPVHVQQQPLIKGDARSLNIAGASVLAKVTRDRLMVEADALWPVYGFAKHKGYPTGPHRAAIAAHGPCPIHRRSFNLPDPADGAPE
jgi:ribonuclease HII